MRIRPALFIGVLVILSALAATPSHAQTMWGAASPADELDRTAPCQIDSRADDDNIVWGTTVDGTRCEDRASDDDNIVWGTALGGGSDDNIIWGTRLDYDDNIVWGTGLSSDDNIVWGTGFDW